jgi:heme exporter protein B
MRALWQLTKREFLREYRERIQLSSSLLYLISSIFVTYLAVQNHELNDLWIALFWIVLLFALVQTSLKSFEKDRPEELLYLSQLANSQTFILSKLIFGGMLALAQTVLSAGLFIMFFEPTLDCPLHFFGVIVSGGLALSFALTFTSAIAIKGKNSTTLAGILGLPVILPILLISLKAHDLITSESFQSVEYIKLLSANIGLGVLSITLAYILIPYLWRD